MKKPVLSILISLSLAFFNTGLRAAETTDGHSDPTKADVTVTPSPTVVASPNFSCEHLKDRWGVGVSSFNYANPAIALRYWASDKEAWDLFIGGSDNPVSGTDSNQNYVSVPNWSYGLGIGLKTVWERPVQDVLVQWVTRLNYSQTFGQNESLGQITTNQYQDLSLITGLGFEAFVPFWRNISIEGMVGLNLDSRWYQYSLVNGSSTTNRSYWGFSTGIFSSIPSLTGGSIHFYF